MILAIAILLWAAMTFPHLHADDIAAFDGERATIETQIAAAETAGNADQKAQLEEQLAAVDLKEGSAALRHSIAGRVGTTLEGLTQFAGFDWRTNIALVGGFAAKEVVVSTLGTAYSLGEVDPEEPENLSQRLLADPAFTTWSAIALIIFTMLYAPCFVTVVAIAKESNWKWAAFSVGFNTVPRLRALRGRIPDRNRPRRLTLPPIPPYENGTAGAVPFFRYSFFFIKNRIILALCSSKCLCYVPPDIILAHTTAANARAF